MSPCAGFPPPRPHSAPSVSPFKRCSCLLDARLWAQNEPKEKTSEKPARLPPTKRHLPDIVQQPNTDALVGVSAIRFRAAFVQNGRGFGPFKRAPLEIERAPVAILNVVVFFPLRKCCGQKIAGV